MKVLGVDWSDLFGGVHEAGSAVLSAFGAGAVAKQLEQVEAPYLPDWAKSATPAGTAGVGVSAPDFVVLLHKGASQGETLSNAAAVVVVGGKRFDGNGYQHGESFGKHFSFGYDGPSRVDVMTKDGKKTSYNDIDKIIFCGGSETQTKVNGEVVGDFNWYSFLDPTALTYESYGQARNVLSPSGAGFYQPTQAQTAYWGQQRAAQQPFLSTTRARMQSGQQLQQALLNEKAARAAAAAMALSAPQPQMPAMQPVPQMPALSVQPIDSVPQPDPNNPGFLTDGNLDPNYQTPSSVVGRSTQMKDDLEILGEQVLTEACGDLGRDGGENVACGGSDDVACGGGGSNLHHRKVEPGFSRHAAAYVLGAAVNAAVLKVAPRRLPHMGIVIKTTPKGRTFTSLVVNRAAKHNPKQTLKTARTVAKRMQQVGQRELKMLDKAAKKTSVKGATGRRVPKIAPAALRRMAQDLIAHGKKLSDTANKYEKSINTLAQQKLAVQKRAQAVTKVHGAVDVLGSDFEHIVGLEQFLLNDAVEILGDYGDPVPDPTNPGYLTDGTPDPNYNGGAGGGGGTTDPTASEPNMPGPPDYGAGPAPTPASVEPQPYIDYQPDPGAANDTTFYDCPTDDDLPLGAIVFDGSHQPPFLTLGNMSCFYGTVPGLDAPKGGPYSGYQLHDDGWWLLLQGTQPSTNYSGGRNYDKVSDPSYAMVAESEKNNWGPLIGAPTLPGTSTPSWTAGLRFSASGPNGPRWFWFYDQAPDWAKQPIRMARMNDAIVAYQAAVAAGKTDYVNQQIQDQLDAQDAAKAAKQQAAVDAQVAQQQEVEQEKEAEQQAQLAQQQATFDEQAYEQQSALQNQMDQAQAAYAAAHPDQFFAPQAPPGYGGDDGGGGDGTDQLPSEMTSDGGSDDFTPMNLDDGQIDWGDGQ